MTDRNWDAELAKIDKQLSSISDEQLVAEKRTAIAKPGATALPPSATRAAPATGPASPGVTASPARGTWRGWLQAVVAVAAAAGLWFWPWPAQCGMPLIGFVSASSAVALLGAWSAVGTWRHRLGAAHLLSLAVVLWGLLLAGREVLPRVGYAVPTAQRGASWECTLPTAPVVTPP